METAPEQNGKEQSYTILQATELTIKGRPLHFFRDISIPEKLQTLQELLQEGHATVVVAQFQQGETTTLLPLFSDTATHEEFDEALSRHYKQLGLPSKPQRIFGAQLQLNSSSQPDFLEFYHPFSSGAVGNVFFDVATAVVGTLDRSRYNPSKPLEIFSSSDRQTYFSYTGGPTLTPHMQAA